MLQTTAHRRLPRAGIDPITDSATAFAMLSLSVHHPRRSETILLLLDEARRGRSIVVVSETTDDDAVVEVIEWITHGLDAEQLGAIVVASVRPDEEVPDGDCLDRDIDRWLEISDISEAMGVELLEWFVIGRSIRCPRDLLGEPPRW